MTGLPGDGLLGTEHFCLRSAIGLIDHLWTDQCNGRICIGFPAVLIVQNYTETNRHIAGNPPLTIKRPELLFRK